MAYKSIHQRPSLFRQTNPKKHVNFHAAYSFFKDRKKNTYFSFRLRKASVSLDYHIDNRSPPCEIGDGKQHC
jgi:hypothetical protein